MHYWCEDEELNKSTFKSVEKCCVEESLLKMKKRECTRVAQDWRLCMAVIMLRKKKSGYFEIEYY